MQQPSAQDQYMLELVNRGRLNPQAEANRYLNGNLNEGLAGGTISTAPKQPLAFNLDLNVAAKNHSQWMLNTNTFSHTGAGGTSSNQRMRNAGYDFAGSWGSGENIAWRGTTGTPNFTGYVGQIYQDLFVDQGISGRGHRKNLMNGSFQEVGISSLQGQFTTGNRTYNSVMTAQDFAYSSNGGPFLTGVAYTDAVTDDDFYTVGEGIGGIQITAVDLTNNSNTFTTTTWNSGGYSLDVAPNKTYRVTFSGDLDGDGQNDDTHVEQVNISGQNVKLDLATDELENSSTVPTPGDDNLTYTAANETINALGGNDTIRAAGGNDSVSGGNGRDHLLGQAGKDTLNGGADHDTLNGGSGNDLLLGQGGNDKLFGQDDADQLIGGTGSDTVNGGNGADTLTGVDPNSSNPGRGERDVLVGKSGSDRFMLGDQNHVFYDDVGTTPQQGNQGRAVIVDFEVGVDRIQLHGSVSDYHLKETTRGHTNIFFEPPGEVRDLIGVVRNTTGISLSDSSVFNPHSVL